MIKLVLSLLLLMPAPCFAANIAILSWHGYLPETVFLSESINRPFVELKKIAQKKGHSLYFVSSIDEFKDADYIVFFNVQVHHLADVMRAYPNKKKLLFLWEPPVVDAHNYIFRYHRFFNKVFTWDDDLLKKKSDIKYEKLYYIIDNLAVINDLISYKDRKFCTLIAGNKSSSHPQELYSSRVQAIEFFERFHAADFEFYGRQWPANRYKTYKGEIACKTDYLKQYKFCICYENMHSVKGYITEKIFDCFIAGCIPVYWGADNITSFIPKSCFIDCRSFKNYQELFAFLKSITQEQFEQYIKEIAKFCQSRRAHRFSIEYFAQKLFKACQTGD